MPKKRKRPASEVFEELSRRTQKRILRSRPAYSSSETEDDEQMSSSTSSCSAVSFAVKIFDIKKALVLGTKKFIIN